ncbi:MAG: TolC family outer membrane protein [Moraxellaceae bacterium]|nr:TolC family outer membrane protein [Moraxellaceae bacterium]
MKRCTALLLGALAATGTQAADLLDVYREAVANDAQYAAARAQLEAGKEKLPQGRAGLLPNIGLAAGTSYNMVDADRPANIERDYNSNSYQLRLTQPLFRWQNWVAYRQGEIQVGIAEAQFLQAKSDLIVRTSQAYFDVLYAEDVLSAVSTLKVANSEQLGLAKKSFEVGTVTITDVNEAQSRYDLTAAQEIAAQADLEIKRNALRVLTGRDPQVLAKLREGVQLISPQPSDLESWVRAAEQSNPNVQAQNLSAEFAKREVERSRAGHLPTLDLVASNGRSHASGSVNGQESLSRSNVVGLELQLPIYQGGATQSRVRESSALYDKARFDLENVRRNAAQLARQSYLGTTSGIAQVKGYEAAMVSGRSSLESNKLGYEVGVRINIDVLNAQTQLADTYAKLQKARYDAIIAQLRLKSAAGSLAEPDVEQVNTLLNR